MNVRETSCCGLAEFENIHLLGWESFKGTPEYCMKQFALYADDDDHPTESTVVFTDIDNHGPKHLKPYQFGDALRDFIKKNKLGSVISTRPVLNGNSGNKVKTYLWRVNVKAFNAKYRPDYGKERHDDDESIW